MGVQGLTTFLTRNGRPTSVCLQSQGAAAQKRRICIVDASAVLNMLVKKAGMPDWTSTDFHQALYHEAFR
jgi:hypothetical protein